MRGVDRGEVSAQTVLVVPVVILILMIAIQAALWFHTANVAAAAAGEGAAAAAVANISSTEAAMRGVRAARELSSDAHSSMVTDPLVAVDPRRVVITVRLSVPRIVPFFPSTVTRAAVEPREVFTSEVDR